MPEVSITQLKNVGDQTVALEIETPTDFDAYPGQFVLIRATIDGEEETSYYTISSPDVEGAFETTVAVTPDGTLGPWLAERAEGDTITIEGPFGNVQYTGEESTIVFAGGPGIGPAVGIGERALQSDREATIVYGGSNPPHADRLDTLQEDGATVAVTNDLHAAAADIELSDAEIYVFGFETFVEEAGKALSASGFDTGKVEIENFGSE